MEPEECVSKEDNQQTKSRMHQPHVAQINSPKQHPKPAEQNERKRGKAEVWADPQQIDRPSEIQSLEDHERDLVGIDLLGQVIQEEQVERGKNRQEYGQRG